MPIYATAGEGRSYAPAPEGPHQAVCVDVIDLGLITSNFIDEKTGQKKVQHKVDVAWQIGEKRDDGKRFVVYKRYTLSIHEKATLRKDLESWRGRPFTEAELKRFDVESVIGANALINVQHNTKDGKTYANVVSVMPIIKGMPKMVAEGYERKTAEPHEPPPHADADEPNFGPEPILEDPPF
jgi:hypothetical protein